MASFAAEIRRQLAAATVERPGRTSNAGRVAELAGLIDASGLWDEEGVTFFTSSIAVARSALRLWRSEFGLDAGLSRAHSLPDRFGRSRHAVRAEGNRALQAAEELQITCNKVSGSTAPAAVCNAYLRGAFQGAGSVTRPGYRRGHHLEFVHGDETFVQRVCRISRATLKVAYRRNRWVAYTKSADGVTTLLSQMGLHEAVLEYEARAIIGEAKANANRVTNFDAANAGRTARSAARQYAALRSLDPDRLPAALQEMLELRLEHPDAPLSELARLGDITKSAANHRLRRLVEISQR